MTTKIHAVVDALGNPIRFFLSEGQESDIANAQPPLCTLDMSGSNVNADRGYDSQAFVDWLISVGALPNIPSRLTNKVQRECDWWLYKERQIKQFSDVLLLATIS